MKERKEEEKMNKKEQLNRILNGSKEYKVDNGVLELTSYHTGERIYIDLREIEEEQILSEEEMEERRREEEEEW